MRVAVADGLVTVFYDGSKELVNHKLNNEWVDYWEHEVHFRFKDDHKGQREWEDWGKEDLSEECKAYWRERHSWQQVVVLEGVIEIPISEFYKCFNLKRVIFANTVVRILDYAFLDCFDLVYIKWSTSLRHIEDLAFCSCNLSSVFMPPTCRFIGDGAFSCNKNLSIFKFPQETRISTRDFVVDETALKKKYPGSQDYNRTITRTWNNWIRNLDNEEEFSLHRACCCYQPLKGIIIGIVVERGLVAFTQKNKVGITPSEYLRKNPYADITEMEIVQSYISKMMGEVE